MIYYDEYKCTVCQNRFDEFLSEIDENDEFSDYCPRCGAKNSIISDDYSGEDVGVNLEYLYLYKNNKDNWYKQYECNQKTYNFNKTIKLIISIKNESFFLNIFNIFIFIITNNLSRYFFKYLFS